MKSQVKLEDNLKDIVLKIINKCTKAIAKATVGNNMEKIKLITNEISELDAKRKTLQWVLQ